MINFRSLKKNQMKFLKDQLVIHNDNVYTVKESFVVGSTFAYQLSDDNFVFEKEIRDIGDHELMNHLTNLVMKNLDKIMSSCFS